jgi:predicted Zn-dependent protease
MNMKHLLPLFCFAFLQISSCAVNPVTGQQDLVLMSESDELALGRKTNAEVLKQYTIYDNPALQSYVQTVGEKLAAKSHRSNLIYRFTVLDSKDVNAFALPGGYIYITRGLMAYLNSEAELAAVLGHEVGHVTARHSVRQYSATQLANIGAVLTSIFVPGMTQASNQLVQFAGGALLRGYGRTHELEADKPMLSAYSRIRRYLKRNRPKLRVANQEYITAFLPHTRTMTPDYRKLSQRPNL